MASRNEELRKGHKEAEDFLTRHCATDEGVILVQSGEHCAVFTSFDKALAYARSRGENATFTAHMLDDPGYSAQDRTLH